MKSYGQQCIIAACAIFVSAGLGAASTVGVNFTNGNELAPADTTGVVSQANWNNADGAMGSIAAGSVIDSTGTTANTSGVSVTWNSTNDYFSAVSPGTPPGQLLAGFLDGGSGGLSATATVTGLSAANTYTVYVYCASNHGAGDGNVSDFSVNGVDVSGVPQDTSGSTTFTQAGNGTTGNYLVFNNVSGPTISIAANTLGEFRSSLDGFQVDGIATPEPATAGLLGLASLGLLARRRNRA